MYELGSLLDGVCLVSVTQALWNKTSRKGEVLPSQVVVLTLFQLQSHTPDPIIHHKLT